MLSGKKPAQAVVTYDFLFYKWFFTIELWNFNLNLSKCFCQPAAKKSVAVKGIVKKADGVGQNKASVLVETEDVEVIFIVRLNISVLV